MSKTSTHIIDTADIGKPFVTFIETILNEYDSIAGPIRNYQQACRIYTELATQAIIAMGNNHTTFLSALINMPDYRYFDDIPCFRIPNVQFQVTEFFKRTALGLFFVINDKLNKQNKKFDYIPSRIEPHFAILTITEE